MKWGPGVPPPEKEIEKVDAIWCILAIVTLFLYPYEYSNNEICFQVSHTFKLNICYA